MAYPGILYCRALTDRALTYSHMMEKYKFRQLSYRNHDGSAQAEARQSNLILSTPLTLTRTVQADLN